MANRVMPPPQPIQSDIALFAKAYFNIELTSYQLQLLHFLAKRKTLFSGGRTGVATVNKVVRAYIAEGLKPGGRVRLPMHSLPPREKMKGVTQHGKVLALIKRPSGAYNFELARVALKYSSRITDLRHEGHDIVADRQYLKNGRASNTWKYRLGGR